MKSKAWPILRFVDHDEAVVTFPVHWFFGVLERLNFQNILRRHGDRGALPSLSSGRRLARYVMWLHR